MLLSCAQADDGLLEGPLLPSSARVAAAAGFGRSRLLSPRCPTPRLLSPGRTCQQQPLGRPGRALTWVVVDYQLIARYTYLLPAVWLARPPTVVPQP